jgi:flagellar assembly protein FliH
MKLWHEAIHFSKPLRDARMAVTPYTSKLEARIREREQLSFERGCREGERALSEQLMRQRSELTELQNGVLDSLRQAVVQVTHDSEGAMVALALEIAGKVVADTPISSEIVEAAVREALAQVEQQGNLVVSLNPMDFELLQQANAPLLLADVGGERLRFQTSPKVSRGGCLVHTRFGVIDAQRETKFKALKQSIESGACN